MINTVHTIPTEDFCFILSYCRAHVYRSYSDGDLEAALFWSTQYIEFLQECRGR